MGEQLRYNSWHYANQLIERIYENTGIDIKENDNYLHTSVKTGARSQVHKYSESFIDLLIKVRDNEDYTVNI